MPPPPLLMQTAYAELLERCRATAFNEAFSDDGTFVSKTINQKRYWYFQQPSDTGRKQKYVGPETPELLEQISHHKQIRDDERERRALVSTLVRVYGLQPPTKEIGDIIAALAKAGAFRLRGVLIGTVAYQTYAPMLGRRLPHSIFRTDDVDIAQFRNLSVAVGDQTPPVLEVLKDVDKTFRSVPHIYERNVTSYISKGRYRVDFLTPNEGRDTDRPQHLPAFQTDAEPLRFLDFLIHEPEPAAVLYNAGIYVLVPSPQRYAIHKLIVSRRRQEGTAKRDKDIQQSAALLDMLADKRPYELKSAWDEAFKRGKAWRQALVEGLSQVPSRTRDTVLKTIGAPRSLIPGIDLTFADPPPRYDFERDVVTFIGEALGRSVRCAISREALDDNFGSTTGLTNKQRLDKFRKNRSTIERMAREKYLFWLVEEPEATLIKTTDVSKLLQALAKKERVRASPRHRDRNDL
ncbi:MAG: GSU2403 family nucleotidyltransferase fold protein [Xanthobacteraceae bacterium]